MDQTTGPVVDLRSDTVTRPTEAMRAAMAQAPVGDDVYGEDPTVTELERRVAALLGHEAAVFTPSGTMANQLGLRLLVGPGEELACDSQAHVVRAELGAAAVFSGITTRTWDAPRGVLDPDVVAAFVRPRSGPYQVSTAAVAVENTHNFGGGTVQPLGALSAVHELARDRGLGLHLDGARLWNAHVATGVPLADYGRLFDTVSVCLSKGLGAPVGSLLASSAERIERARVWRKRYGGGMRQAGVLAAAGLHALDHHVVRLADDHARARRIAEAVHAVVPSVVDPASVETNIVVLGLAATGWDGAGLAAAAAQQGVLVSSLGPRLLRLVTHLDVDDAGADLAATVLAGLLAAG
jgi:threonine aldolase